MGITSFGGTLRVRLKPRGSSDPSCMHQELPRRCPHAGAESTATPERSTVDARVQCTLKRLSFQRQVCSRGGSSTAQQQRSLGFDEMWRFDSLGIAPEAIEEEPCVPHSPYEHCSRFLIEKQAQTFLEPRSALQAAVRAYPAWFQCATGGVAARGSNRRIARDVRSWEQEMSAVGVWRVDSRSGAIAPPVWAFAMPMINQLASSPFIA